MEGLVYPTLLPLLLPIPSSWFSKSKSLSSHLHLSTIHSTCFSLSFSLSSSIFPEFLFPFSLQLLFSASWYFSFAFWLNLTTLWKGFERFFHKQVHLLGNFRGCSLDFETKICPCFTFYMGWVFPFFFWIQQGEKPERKKVEKKGGSFLVNWAKRLGKDYSKKKRGRWRFSVMCARKLRQLLFVVQMKRLSVLNAMWKFMQQTSLQASTRGFFFSASPTSYRNVTYAK